MKDVGEYHSIDQAILFSLRAGRIVGGGSRIVSRPALPTATPCSLLAHHWVLAGVAQFHPLDSLGLFQLKLLRCDRLVEGHLLQVDG